MATSVKESTKIWDYQFTEPQQGYFAEIYVASQCFRYIWGEARALLVGCCKLHQMHVMSADSEANSIFITKWVFLEDEYPWHLVDTSMENQFV